MNSFHKAGIAIAAAALSAISLMPSASAGGLHEPLRGSMKDAPVYGASSVSRCYLRGDVGYSVSGTPTVHVASPRYSQIGTDDEDMENAFMGEIGIGCGSGSRGFRADMTLGYRGERDVTGYKTNRPGFHYPGTFETQVSTLTAMANLYYDFGKIRNFVPYVGVGLGIAHHSLSDTSFSLGNPGHLPGPVGPAPSNGLSGNDETDFAWSLMVGAAYQISDRAVLDFGYRYIDLGDVSSKRGHICSTSCGGGSRDKLSVEDITAHEFKVGLRYHFGGHSAPAYK
jgi:opacity protein-like surface antigen